MCHGDMLSDLFFYGEVHACISVVSHSNFLSMSDSSIADGMEILPPFVLEMAKSTWAISVVSYFNSLSTSNGSSADDAEILSSLALGMAKSTRDISADSQVVSMLIVNDSSSDGMEEILSLNPSRWLCSQAVSQWRTIVFQC